MLATDSILQNRYRVVRQLGAGGMGAIYEAIDQRVRCVVVIKETLVGPNTEARQAFQNEAALLANLRHASLPKVMDYFGEADGEFLVMEHIAGRDLAELLEAQGGPFPQDQVLAWAEQLLRLLEYLHTRDPSIVHRDIKPANLKVTDDGEIFLLDFGLAKGAAGQMTTVSTGGSVYGYTPLYAPLEQIHGRGTDPRSDLYSLGATLYDLLAGQPPVSAPARFETIENDGSDPLPPVNKLNSLVSAAVADIIRKAMAMSRRERFQTASEMRAALARFREASAELAAARRSAETSLDYERAEIDQSKPLVADENVQFTVYTPRQIKPQETYTMLAFAHLSKKREGAPPDEPDPVALMKDQAARILGNQQTDYEDTKQESGQMVPREGELLFVPRAEGITFIPPSRSFTWRKSVHREEFDLKASTDLDGQRVSGTLTVFLGSVVIAEVPLKFSIDGRAESAAEKVSLETPQTGRRVRQIFASYSPRDEQIVNELAQVAPIFGSQFITDRTHLMPGEDRSEGAKRLISGADAFQLFWSSNSMRSPDVMEEIDYAISLNKKNFILPTYWEDPLPRSPHENLPREELERLHFFRIYPGSISPATNQTTAVSKSTGPVSASAQTLSPSAGSTAVFEPPPGVVRCTRCNTTFDAGMKYCGRCGGETFEPASRPRGDTLEPAPAEPVVIPETIMAQRKVTAPLPSPVLPAAPVAVAPKRPVRWTPIYAGAAMVLLAMIMVPAWLLMNSGTKSNVANMPSASRALKGFTGAGGIEFVYIAPGKFMMGSNDHDSNELPVHQVTINHMFYLGKYEVTQAQWQAVMGNNPSNFKDCGNCPVEQVTWNAAQDFIRKLNQMNDGYGYRLPSEAEWEYACRAGTSGDYPGDPKEMAWFGENASGRTHPVGQKQPNAWGLYDILGNALEWCEDWYHSKYDGAPTDGSAWLNGGEQKYRVIRGGSWNSGTVGIRSASRGLLNPDGTNSQFGFRVVAVPRTQ